MKFLILLILAMLSACLMNEEQMTEEELMRKQQQFIDTTFVKDLHVDTTYEIRTTKINDSVTIFDTLTIVRSITKNDTINNVTTLNKVDSVYSVRYDTIFKTTHLDTIRTIITDSIFSITTKYDTLRTIVFDTLRIVKNDTINRIFYDTLRTIIFDTIIKQQYSTGIEYDDTRNNYFPWHMSGVLQVSSIRFLSDVILDSFITSYYYEYSNIRYLTKTSDSNKLFSTMYQHRGGVAQKFVSPCPNGWRIPTQKENAYLLAFGDTSYKLNAGIIDSISNVRDTLINGIKYKSYFVTQYRNEYNDVSQRQYSFYAGVCVKGTLP